MKLQHYIGVNTPPNVGTSVPSIEDNVIHIHEIDDTFPELRSLRNLDRYSIATGIIVFLLIGSFFKCVLYRYILVSSKINNGSYLKMTPINSMIFISAFVHHLTHLFTGVNYSISIGSDLVLEDIFGTGYCNVMNFTGNNLLFILHGPPRN